MAGFCFLQQLFPELESLAITERLLLETGDCTAMGFHIGFKLRAARVQAPPRRQTPAPYTYPYLPLNGPAAPPQPAAAPTQARRRLVQPRALAFLCGFPSRQPDQAGGKPATLKPKAAAEVASETLSYFFLHPTVLIESLPLISIPSYAWPVRVASVSPQAIPVSCVLKWSTVS